MNSRSSHTPNRGLAILNLSEGKDTQSKRKSNPDQWSKKYRDLVECFVASSSFKAAEALRKSLSPFEAIAKYFKKINFISDAMVKMGRPCGGAIEGAAVNILSRGFPITLFPSGYNPNVENYSIPQPPPHSGSGTVALVSKDELKVFIRDTAKQTVEEILEKMMSSSWSSHYSFPDYNAVEFFYDYMGGTFWMLLHDNDRKVFYPIFIRAIQDDSSSERVAMMLMGKTSFKRVEAEAPGSILSNVFYQLGFRKGIKDIFIHRNEKGRGMSITRYQHLGDADSFSRRKRELEAVLREYLALSVKKPFPIKAYRKNGCTNHQHHPLPVDSFSF